MLDGKNEPLDFVLWKSAKDSEPEDAKWDSAALGHDYGKGRPGWYIECSAMSVDLLGQHFDIHAGGRDIIFPHHEKELDQSQEASHQKLVNGWMHDGILQMDKEKMSKSFKTSLKSKNV